jgi:hypothetical protein
VLQTWPETGQTVFQFILERCGQFVGIGRFRPRNRGFYGRFLVTDFVVLADLAQAA